MQCTRDRQDHRLRRCLWPVAWPRGIVLCIHAFGDDTGSLLCGRCRPQRKGMYSRSAAMPLNKRDCSVTCMDLRGCRKSPRTLTVFSGSRDGCHRLRRRYPWIAARIPQLHPIFCPRCESGNALKLVRYNDDPLTVFAGDGLLAPMLSVESIRGSGLID